jgi:hypothetical protein
MRDLFQWACNWLDWRVKAVFESARNTWCGDCSGSGWMRKLGVGFRFVGFLEALGSEPQAPKEHPVKGCCFLV